MTPHLSMAMSVMLGLASASAGQTKGPTSVAVKIFTSIL